jgi:hypothetical protein
MPGSYETVAVRRVPLDADTPSVSRGVEEPGYFSQCYCNGDIVCVDKEVNCRRIGSSSNRVK